MQKYFKQQSRLWDYVINKKIGQGQYGEVFQVIDRTSDQVFALKKMAIAGSQEQEKLQTFKQIKFLKLISHPSIIQYKQSFLSMDNIYIVMQYAAKGDFLKIVQQKKKKQKYYAQDQLWKMFESIIQGVKYLHEKNIIHRDLKLQNIFMTSAGKVKIGDLGMSKIMARDDQLISTREGTPMYFAPQMIRNQLYSFPVDIWSLGCVFYSLATLEHPFQQATIQTLAYHVIENDPKPIKGQYGVQLINFVNCCLEKDSKKRPNIFELALKLKNKNHRQQINNRISIFNLRHLTKILTSQGQIQQQNKCQDQTKRKIPPLMHLNTTRKFYLSENARNKIQTQNIRLNAGQRSNKNNFMLESPESPTTNRRSCSNRKSQTYHPIKMVSTDFNQNSINSQLIKSSGFSLQMGQKDISPLKRSEHFPEFGMTDSSPGKMALHKRTVPRRSYK